MNKKKMVEDILAAVLNQSARQPIALSFSDADLDHIFISVSQALQNASRRLRVVKCEDAYDVEASSKITYMGNVPVVQVALQKAVKESLSSPALRKRCVMFTKELYAVTSCMYGDNYVLNVFNAIDAGDEIIFCITYDMWCR